MRQAAARHQLCILVVLDWAQWWKCQICGSDISGYRQACLDHDHATGRPRGVICRRCNIGLSFLDSPAWVDRAQQYIDRHIDHFGPQPEPLVPVPAPELPRDVNRQRGGIRRLDRNRWQVRVSKGPLQKDGRTIYPEITRVVKGSRAKAIAERQKLLQQLRACA
jgi:hypothetical protein